MNLEHLIRYTLAVYLACGCLHALALLLLTAPHRDPSDPSNAAPRIAARVLLITLLGFLPALPPVTRFLFGLPRAFQAEWLEFRTGYRAGLEAEQRVYRDTARRNLATYDPRDEVRQ